MPSASTHSSAIAQVPRPEPKSVELSVVMPCLNEAETLEACILKAQRALLEACISGEIIIADNGSTDGSPEIAERLGAKVVHVTARGYGNALMGGIAAAAGSLWGTQTPATISAISRALWGSFAKAPTS